jgi:hypothetical protein
MNTTSHQDNPKRRSRLKGRMADTPHGVDHPRRIVPKVTRKRLKKSIYFGQLLYILWTEFEHLSTGQQLWIVNFARRLSDEEILRAGRHSQKLLTDPDSAFFHSKDIMQTRKSIPWIEPFQSPETVRIGKGYTDKGALRPLHKKGLPPKDFPMWDEDILYLLPLDYVPKGEWLTAEEVQSLIGSVDIGLLFNQLNQGRYRKVGEFFSQPYLGQ